MNTNKRKILFIDDEENILSSLKRIFHKSEFEVVFTTEPDVVFKKIKEEKFAVVVSDQRMPKMEGVEVLKNVRSLSPDTVRIMLTGYADIKSAMRAVNDGNVFRFLAKPWNEDEIRGAIAAGVRHYDLIEEHRQLTNLTRKQNAELMLFNEELEKKVEERTSEISKLNTDLKATFFTTIKLMGGLAGIFNPSIEGHTFRVAKIAGYIGKEIGLSEKEIFDIQVAAFLYNIGCIGSKVQNNEIGPPDIKLGAKIISLIPNLGKAPLFVLHQLERFDGEGYPNKLRGNKIPIGSRIITAAADYDRMLYLGDYKKASPANVLELIKSEASSKYDPDVVRGLYRYVEHHSANSEKEFELQLGLEGLQVGMIVSRAVLTKRGETLVAKDFELNEEVIEGLWQRQMNEQPIAEIFVYKSSINKLVA